MNLRNITLNATQREELSHATRATDVVRILGILNRNGMVPSGFGREGVHVEISSTSSTHRSAFALSDPANQNFNARGNSSAAHRLWSDFTHRHNFANANLNNNLRSIFRVAANCAHTDSDKKITSSEWSHFRLDQLGAAAAANNQYSDQEFIAAVALARFLDADEQELMPASELINQINNIRNQNDRLVGQIGIIGQTLRGLNPLVNPLTIESCLGNNNVFDSAACQRIAQEITSHSERRDRATHVFESNRTPNVERAVQIGAYITAIGLGFLLGRRIGAPATQNRPRTTATAVTALPETLPTISQVAEAQQAVPPAIVDAEVAMVEWISPSNTSHQTPEALDHLLGRAVIEIFNLRSNLSTAQTLNQQQNEQLTNLTAQLVEELVAPLQTQLHLAEAKIASQNQQVVTLTARIEALSELGSALRDYSAGHIRELSSNNRNLQNQLTAATERFHQIQQAINELTTNRGRERRELMVLSVQLSHSEQLIDSIIASLPREGEAIPAIRAALTQLKNSIANNHHRLEQIATTSNTMVQVTDPAGNNITIEVPMGLSLNPNAQTLRAPAAPSTTPVELPPFIDFYPQTPSGSHAAPANEELNIDLDSL